ncbi:hypothetical protein FC778_15315 [Clostridium botulinum]|nr:hypothetical protein [Clostridium botulinum]
MKLEKICKTCEFNFSGICAEHDGIYSYGEKINDFSKECDCWSSNLTYYSKIIKEAPWYIRDPYKECKIDYDTFIELIEKDYRGEPIDVSIYDVIEKVYGVNTIQLAVILDVSVGVITYAKNRGTVDKRVDDFSKKLNIPQEYFKKCTTKDFEQLKQYKFNFNNKIPIKKLNNTKSMKKVINLISECLGCNTKLASEFLNVSKIEWSTKTKLNELNSLEKKVIMHIINKNQIKGSKLSKFTYYLDGNSNPRLNLIYSKK